MKKLILTICFSVLIVSNAVSKVTPVGSLATFQKQQPINNEPPKVKKISAEEFKEIIEKGFSKSLKVDTSKINQNVSVVKRDEAPAESKSIFEKIYDKALERVSAPAPDRKDVAQKTAQPVVYKRHQNWRDETLPTITALLPPDNRPTKILAQEHIPYLMSAIEVLPSGLVKFEETIVVVANGEKLRQGLTKILPRYIYNEKGKRQKLDYSIIAVTVNETPLESSFKENAETVYLVPKDDYVLEPGIYTYKFEYVVDNLLWKEDGTYRFFWDIGGNGWNLVVDRLGASLNLPKDEGWISTEALIGYPKMLSKNQIEFRKNGPTAWAYVAKRPLFIGEGMYVFASIDSQALAPETLWQKFSRALYNNGEVFVAGLGFIVIALSFVLSWRYIKKDKGQLKFSLPKTALTLRYLTAQKVDMRALCGFFLEMYKKNIIDIQDSEDKVFLVKKTDNLGNLTLSERKALAQLFPKHETIFNVTADNTLPLKRFARILKKEITKKMLKFRVKLCFGYLLMGAGLIFLTTGVISLLSYQKGYIFGVLSGAVILSLLGTGLLFGRFGKVLKILACLVGFGILGLALILMSAVIAPLAGVFLIASSLVVGAAIRRYSAPDGLMGHYLKDVQNYKDYLIKHKETIVLGRDFANHQAAVWVFELEDDFVSEINPKDNRMPMVKKIVKMF